MPRGARNALAESMGLGFGAGSGGPDRRLRRARFTGTLRSAPIPSRTLTEPSYPCDRSEAAQLRCTSRKFLSPGASEGVRSITAVVAADELREDAEQNFALRTDGGRIRLTDINRRSTLRDGKANCAYRLRVPRSGRYVGAWLADYANM